MRSEGTRRKPTNVTARADLVEEAKALGVNLSDVFEAALRDAVRERRRAEWTESNREAFAAYDAFVETHGVYSDGKRLF